MIDLHFQFSPPVTRSPYKRDFLYWPLYLPQRPSALAGLTGGSRTLPQPSTPFPGAPYHPHALSGAKYGTGGVGPTRRIYRVIYQI